MSKLIEHFKEEHKEIRDIFDNLSSYMLGERVAKVDLIVSLRDLKAKIIHHVDEENNYLYPKLIELKNKKESGIGKKASKDMIGLGKKIFAFFDKYIHLKVSELEKNNNFKNDLKTTAEIFIKRNNFEEDILFPVYDKYYDEEEGKKKSKEEEFDMSKIKAEIEKKLKKGDIEEHEAQILEQRAPAKHVVETLKEKKGKVSEKFIKTGVPGFDELFENGIPKGNAVLVAGGAGSGKTIFCLQTLNHHAEQGEKCFYMSFEESEERLIKHMDEFGWNAEKLIKDNMLRIKRMSPFEITRSVEGMLEKEKGELLIDIDPVLLPEGFNPDFIVLDSLTAVASAFYGREETYRIYIEQLFRFFEKLGATAFLITETKQIPEIFSTTGVEEFLADGVIVLYNLKRGDVRENAIEVLKMRGEKHQKKIVAMQITEQGIVVYPEQEVFGGIEEK